MKNNLENIFKDLFESFESEVRSMIWEKIKIAID